MSLQDMPNEILLRISWYVSKCPTCHCRHNTHDLFALSRSSRHLHCLLTPGLLRTSTAMHMLLWAIWHNRLDLATKAITNGAGVNLNITEKHNVARHTAHVGHGTPLTLAFRNRLRPMDPAACQLALEICEVLLDGGGIPSIHALAEIVEGGDADLLRICLPHITDINERASQHGSTLLELATNAGHEALVALLVSAGASMESTSEIMHFWIRSGVCVQIPMDRSAPDFRTVYPGWDQSRRGSWDEWGPVCMLPGPRHGCMCPWCPLEVTGGYTVMRVIMH